MNQDISLASLILAQQLNGGSWGAFSWETIHMLSWIFQALMWSCFDVVML